jgi:hypothetical protein
VDTRTQPARPHGRRYPWDAWLRRLPVTLVRGIDFLVEPSSFGINARLAARARGHAVAVRVAGNAVIIEATDAGTHPDGR